MSNIQDDFETWLAQQLDADDLRLEGWTSPKDTGYSNETNIFDAHFTRHGQSQILKLVQRLGPADGATMFKEYDLERQCRIMKYLNDHSSLPVPTVVGMAMEAERPYYVMEFIDGEIPKDGHTADTAYTTDGFLFEATPEQRHQYFMSLVRSMAELHKVPVTDEFRNYFQRAEGDASHMQKEVDWWVDLYHWGKGGADVDYPQLDSHINEITNSVPELDDACLVWQDGRPANTIVQNYEVAAMLDWELATLGPGEQDLFFHFSMHAVRERQPGANQLQGLPTEAEQIALYEEITGRKIRHEEFFRNWVRIRMAIIQLVFCKALSMPLEEIDYTAALTDDPFDGNYG